MQTPRPLVLSPLSRVQQFLQEAGGSHRVSYIDMSQCDSHAALALLWWCVPGKLSAADAKFVLLAQWLLSNERRSRSSSILWTVNAVDA